MINSNELLFVVDEQNNPIEPAPRKIVHERGYWHRTVHVWLINDKKEILCQQRSILKDIHPGLWEPHFGGHLNAGKDEKEDAVIEAKEEVGLEISQEQLHFHVIHKNEQVKEFQYIYSIIWNGEREELRLEEDEVVQVKWVALDELKKVMERKDKAWIIPGYMSHLLPYLLKI